MDIKIGDIYFNRGNGRECLITQVEVSGDKAWGHELIPEWRPLWRGKAVKRDQQFEGVNLIELLELTRLHYDKMCSGETGRFCGVEMNKIPASLRIALNTQIHGCDTMTPFKSEDGRVMVRFASDEREVPNSVVEMDANVPWYALKDKFKGILSEQPTVENISTLKGGERVYDIDNCECLIVDSMEMSGMFSDHPGEYIRCQKMDYQIRELKQDNLIKREDCENKEDLLDCDRAEEKISLLMLPPCEENRGENWDVIPRVLRTAMLGQLNAYHRFVEPDLEAEPFEFEFKSDWKEFENQNYTLTPEKLRTGLRILRVFLLNN